MTDNENFNYTYSAKEMDEIRKIKEKYEQGGEPKEETPIERLRRLDRTADRVATIASLVLGIVGVLVMGFGMSMIMTTFGEAISPEHYFEVGICVGILGGIVAGVAYPVFNLVQKKTRKKLAPEILKLTEEIGE
ncbi:MAG: hypothetical protein IJF38_03165 [Clostridia bacterium]|nr:hypothetical protein [Clostridia bacterium]